MNRKRKITKQVSHSQLNQSHRKEDLQRANHSQKSDSTKDVKTTVPVQVNYSQLDESQRSDSTKDVTATVPDKNDKKL